MTHAKAQTPFEVPMNTPKWTSSNVSVGFLVEAIGQGENYDIDPEHQRNIVHTGQWKAAIIESVFTTGCIPPTFWHPNKDDPDKYDSVDGKQRCAAFLEYVGGSAKWKWRGKSFNKLDASLQKKIRNFELILMKSNRTLTADELRDTFQRFQITKKTTLGEVWNADLCPLREHLHTMVDDDSQMLYDAEIYDEDRCLRYPILEQYGKLYVHYCSKKTNLNRKQISTLWSQHRTADAVQMHHFRRLITDMWEILITTTDTAVERPVTKTIPLFCALRMVKDEYYEDVVVLLKKSFAVFIQNWENIDGNHSGHHKRYLKLTENIQQSCLKWSDCVLFDEECKPSK